MHGITYPNLTGGVATMFPNHHLSKPVLMYYRKSDDKVVTN